jgi:two-component sensor histidine kinase
LVDLLARQIADYIERKRSEEIENTLVREVQHWSNNLLAVIQTIASRSLSGKTSLTEAKAAFEARLQALARANNQVTKSNWSGVKLADIVRAELELFSERVDADGVNVSLSPKHTQNFSLALHELATNAAKYGALSKGSGKVEISRALTSHGETNSLKFRWRKSGGPPVVTPTEYGFGTALLKATFPDARFEYASDGLYYEVDVPLGTSDRPAHTAAS